MKKTPTEQHSGKAHGDVRGSERSGGFGFPGGRQGLAGARPRPAPAVASRGVDVTTTTTTAAAASGGVDNRTFLEVITGEGKQRTELDQQKEQLDRLQGQMQQIMTTLPQVMLQLQSLQRNIPGSPAWQWIQPRM